MVSINFGHFNLSYSVLKYNGYLFFFFIFASTISNSVPPIIPCLWIKIFNSLRKGEILAAEQFSGIQSPYYLCVEKQRFPQQL